MKNRSIIIIPARMASTRLPGKPLADIHGKPMICHVIDRAKESGIKDVVVACAEEEIAEAVTKHNCQAILTDPNHPSGTDRIYEAYTKTGRDYDFIINVQGDLPTLEPKLILDALYLLENDAVDIGTLAAPILEDSEKQNPNITKPIMSFYEPGKHARALYFTRATAPYGSGDIYHHIGLYAYRKEALKKFISLPPSPLEKREKLEQLRALENNMRIDVAVEAGSPLGVDTEEDLKKARDMLGKG